MQSGIRQAVLEKEPVCTERRSQRPVVRMIAGDVGRLHADRGEDVGAGGHD